MQHMEVYYTFIETDRAVRNFSKLLIWLYGYIYRNHKKERIVASYCAKYSLYNFFTDTIF